METWNSFFNKGKHSLTRHKPHEALPFFIEALNCCPVTDNKSHARILFYLGATLKKLRFDNSALKSWILGMKFNKVGYSFKMIQRFSNEYGMIKQDSTSMDDWQAFFSLQLAKYIQGKKTKKIGSPAELDMVKDLIYDSWKEVQGHIADMKANEKTAFFRSVTIMFPIPGNRQEFATQEAIPYNFRLKKHITGTMRCFCGSNIPYALCCGRITSGEELINGCF